MITIATPKKALFFLYFISVISLSAQPSFEDLFPELPELTVHSSDSYDNNNLNFKESLPYPYLDTPKDTTSSLSPTSPFYRLPAKIEISSSFSKNLNSKLFLVPKIYGLYAHDDYETPAAILYKNTRGYFNKWILARSQKLILKFY